MVNITETVLAAMALVPTALAMWIDSIPPPVQTIPPLTTQTATAMVAATLALKKKRVAISVTVVM